MADGRVDVELQTEPSAKQYEDLFRGQRVDGDCGSPVVKPPWFDQTRYERGRKVIWDNLFVCLLSHLVGLVFGVTSLTPFKILVSNGNHSSVRAVACRYVSTTKHVISWYRSDIFDPTSEGHKSLQRVRKMHLGVNQYMHKLQPLDEGNQWISQYWMALTQSTFILMMVMNPAKVGLGHLTDDDLESIVYFWRCIGYLLGISDEFNVCSNGLSTFRKITNGIIEHELRPSMLAAKKGQMNLSAKIYEALLSSSSQYATWLTYPSLVTSFVQFTGLQYRCDLSRRERFYSWVLTWLLEGRLLSFRVVRWLARRRLLNMLRAASTDNFSKLSNDLIEDLDSEDTPSCPFVSVGRTRQG